MKPVLLMLPGMLNDERIWAPVMARLGEAAELRVADLTTGVDVPAMAAQCWALLDDVPAGRPLVLAGFSMGGYVALQMLAHPARRVQALALVSTSARPESPEAAALREKTIAAIGRDFGKVIDNLSLHGTADAFQADAAALAHLRELMRAVGPEAAERQNRAVMSRADQREMVRGLQLRCAVVVGEDDRITPPALSEELAALIPGARLTRLPSCGHMAPIEQPDAVADALRSLLVRQEKSV
jgi:pimeloyl-ACP methyl ester carboxylesterase